MYPILMRLADRGLLETSWEAGGENGRPPRHLYRITKSDRTLVAELAKVADSARSPSRPRRLREVTA